MLFPFLIFRVFLHLYKIKQIPQGHISLIISFHLRSATLLPTRRPVSFSGFKRGSLRHACSEKKPCPQSHLKRIPNHWTVRWLANLRSGIDRLKSKPNCQFQTLLYFHLQSPNPTNIICKTLLLSVLLFPYLLPSHHKLLSGWITSMFQIHVFPK